MSTPDNIEDIYELTPMQQGMLFHSLLDPGKGMYIAQMSCEVAGSLPEALWRDAWQAVLERHPVLRSSFMWEGLEKPLQIVSTEVELPWHVEDLRGQTKPEQEAYLERFMLEDRQRGFAPDVAPLIRCSLFQLDERLYRFVWTYHHVLLDGWCFSIVLREVLETVEKGADALPPPARPYRDYIAWLQEQDPKKAEAFWRDGLRGFSRPTPLPFMSKSGAEPSRAAPEDVIRHLPRELTAKLTSFAKAHRFTLNTLLQSAWALVLGRAADADEVVFGVTVSGRPAELVGSEGMVGLFINTLPLRVRLEDAAPVTTFLAAIQAQQGAVDAFGYSSLADIQVWSSVPSDQHLFESLLVFENYPIDKKALLERNHLEISGITTHERTNLPLAVVGIPGERLELRLMYDAAAYSKKDIERIGGLVEATLSALLTHETVGEIGLLDPASLGILAEWTQNVRAFPARVSVPAAIAERAAASPEAIALVASSGETLSYRALDERANRLAQRLIALGVGRETLVAVAIPRSIDWVVALLGIMKAGGAYLPLDPSYPAERLKFILSDASPRVLLVSGGSRGLTPLVPELDIAALIQEANGGPKSIRAEVSSADLAYVIYTSGSTGLPKGVLVTHENLLNLIAWHTEAFGLTACDRTSQVASPAFDASTWELWPTLVAGATLFLAPADLATAPEELSRWLLEHRISIAFLPTPVAEAALCFAWPKDAALRFLLTGGDRLHAFPPAGLPFQLINNYGPTETTVVATSGAVPSAADLSLPSIGRPVANARIYVLDRARRMVAPGVVGELFIGGLGVARGYLNRPELTSERFVPDPFNKVPGARMYASGDLASFHTDGTLRFVGRRDRQVQVRGVRVEPGEIEGTLTQLPGITAAAVVSEGEIQNGDVRLVAFVAGPSLKEEDAKGLTVALAEKLPPVMLPRRVVVVPELPLTSNGKVDYALLAERAKVAPEEAAYVAPKTQEEEVLAGIFASILGKSRVGVTEDFFDLGGHSLKATQVVARAREAFGVEIPLRLIFEKRTVASFAEAIFQGGASLEPIPPVDITADVPSAPGQERLWFIDTLTGPSAAYNVPLVLRLKGPLDTGALARSLRHLVDRHLALRTTFHEAGGSCVQRIGPVPEEVLTVEDVDPSRLDLRVQREVEAPFELAKGPLFRASLFRVGPREAALVINQHHIIADAGSLAILLRELGETYAALVAGQAPNLRPLPIRYADWAAWQRSRLASGKLDASLEHWRHALKGAPPSLALPADRPRPATQTFRGKTKSFVLDAALSRNVAALAQKSGASLFMTLLGGFAAYLARISGQEDLVIGVPAANRDRRETEGLVGFFLNTLAIRLDLSGDPTFAELLARVRKAALSAYANQEVPFERVVAALGIPRELAHNPLFQVMFTVQGESAEDLALGELELTMPAVESSSSKFDLTMVVEPRGELLACTLEYSTDLFDDERIDRLITQLGTVLGALVKEPDAPISEAPILSEAERAQILAFSAGSNVHVPMDAPIHDLVVAHARTRPDAVALVGADGATLTYRELEQQTGSIARHLVAQGVTKGVLVGVAIERSLLLVVAELAVLRAGGAYLPLDPSYPPERLSYLIGDATPRVILTLGGSYPAGPGVIDLERAAAEGEKLRTELPAVQAGDLAYVIYTSGSTGAPKGVQITHANLLNLVFWHNQEFSVTAEDRATQLASLAFDATVWEIWPPLLEGAALYVVPQSLVTTPEALMRWLVENGITVCFLPTPLAEVVLTLPWPSSSRLRIMHTAGDRLHVFAPPGLPFALFNDYGPTETTVCATSGRIGEAQAGLPSIGRPIGNYRVYILDAHRRLLPRGVVGEIFIGGAGVSLGYLHRPELTRERFVADPYARVPNATMYATGDLGSFNADGTIAFHGRRDRQVKVRGVRIELGEIEAALAACPGVSAAAVITEEKAGATSLLAFVSGAKALSPADLSQALKDKLPVAMIPSRIVVLDALPLTSNGKIDHAALKARAPVEGQKARVAPRTAEEEVLAAIFADVLKQTEIGVEDDFFELGGHSLSATQVASRMREAFGKEAPVRLIFERRTVFGILSALGKEAASVMPIPRLGDQRDLPLAPGQESLWFIDALGGQGAAYNVPLVLRLKGSLDVRALGATFDLLVERHEVLRTTFHEHEGSPIQRIGAAHHVVLLPEDVDPSELDARIEREISLPFSLEKGPLFRARLLRAGKDDYALVLNLHHIIVDAWSIGVILRELSMIYSALATGAAPALPALPIRYADWAAFQKQQEASEGFQKSVEFWRHTLLPAPELLSLPADRDRPERQSFRGKTKAFSLPAPVGQELEVLSRGLGASPFMTLLAAFALYLGRLSGQEDLIIGSPAANRDRKETEGLVGYFLNTLAFRVDLTGDPTFAELVERVRKVALSAYSHQDVPFEKLVASLEVPRNLSHNPLFQVMFVLQGQEGGEVQLPALKVELAPFESATSKFDLTLFAETRAGGLSCLLEYSTDLFEDARIERMAAHLARVLTIVAKKPTARASELVFLSPEEERLLEALNQTRREYAEGTLPELFARQAVATPDAIALEHRGETRTYRQLDEESTALANRLAELGVGPNALVAICLERSLLALISVLATLKAGGAYVPLDPSYPPDRLRFMLEDARASVLLTDAHHQDLCPQTGVRLLLVSDQLLKKDAGPFTKPALRPSHLAYVIYTSGSTGRPKGVAMPHRALVNLIEWQREELRPARTLQFAPLSFDVSFQETFFTWCSGGTLVLVDEATRRDPDALVQLLDAAGIERLFLPSVALHHVAQASLSSHRPLPKLKQVITAGDQLRVTEPIRRWCAEGHRELHNHYGPTESHVVTAHALTGDPGAWPGLPAIGRPIANCQVFVLDAQRRPVPVGVPGELYLAGTCLADGYLWRPELTKERFVELTLPAPIRAYRTGDLVRVAADGTLDFLGRADDQVKVRGFRIEPGEIERALCAHPKVKDAAVIAEGDLSGEKRLLAYVLTDPSTAETLAGFLAADLPDYMVPSRFIAVDQFPRTPSGKVDRRALAKPPELPAPPFAPETQTQTEALVAGVFGEVLGRPSVGLTQDFFALGGHSLLAMQLVARLRDRLRVEVRVSDIFERKTAAALARLVDERRAAGGTLAVTRIERAPEGAAIPLSFSQERLWFLDQLHRGSSAYNLPIALRFKGALDVRAMEAALLKVLERHRVLSSRFVEREGRVWQEPVVGGTSPLSLVELLGASPEALTKAVQEEAARPFDLEKGPLFRARLFKVASDEHVVVSTMHHAVGDGWSIGVLVRELSALYNAQLRHDEALLPPVSVDFYDYAHQQRRVLSGELLAQRLDHWREVLEGAPDTLNLPTDRPRTQKPSLKGATARIALGPELSSALAQLAEASGATTFMVLLGAWALYLSRLSGQDDVVIGTPVANRDTEELEAMIGFFVGTLPIRVDLAGDPTFLELLARARRSALDAFAHQDIPLEKIVEAVQPERHLSHAPLFQAMLVLQNTPASTLNLPGLAVESVDLDIGIAKSDLSLVLEPGPQGLSGALEYSTDLFDADRMGRMVQQLSVLLREIARDPGRPLSELPLLPSEERRQLVSFSKGTTGAGPKPSLFHERFEALARANPGAIALECGEAQLSYAALNERANQVAHRLISFGVGPEKLVALSVSRSFDLIAGLLAIWKAGGAYVPLDPAYPKSRLDEILVDSGAEVLVTTHDTEQRWRAAGVRTLWIDEATGDGPRTNPDRGVRAEHPAYVIYTSGSTGKPKGVVIEHRGLANLPEIHRQELGVTACCVVLQFASASFDASVWELAMALGSGGKLVMVPADTLLAGDALADVLAQHHVTHATLPPSSLLALPEDRSFPALRQLISAGEACTPEVVKRWAQAGVAFYNGYGPTESTVCTTLGLCDPEASGPPPIGRPALNLEGWVLDAHGALAPIGVPGELCIGGVGLARGYLGREELTRQKFIPNPHEAGARLYKSGDLVRWRSDGRLEYLGRIDDQVKIRGFRIELQEIDAVLSAHPSVAQVLVLAHGAEGQKRLIAYVVPRGPAGEAALLAHAKVTLPEFMIPSEVVFLDAFPLTPNGKVDRKRLPAPRQLQTMDAAEYVAPRTLIEEQLAEIWAALLGRARISAHDDFFLLGGHSLLAAQVMSRVRKVFGTEVPLSAIFEHPKLNDLAEVITAQAGKAPLPSLVRAELGLDRPLSFAQERLRFLAELEGESPAYNIPMALKLRGKLSVPALAQSLADVVERHEALRTCFPIVAGTPVARVGAAPAALLVQEDLGAHGEAAALRRIAEESAKPFDLAEGPVLRCHLFRLGAEEHVLLMVMHHIVADGWSIGVLLRELTASYRAHELGERPLLAPLPVQYSDYAAWQRGWLNGEARDQQLSYWKKALGGAPSVLELPSDRPRPVVASHRGGVARIDLSQELTQKLVALGPQAGTTLYITLLAAFGVYLGRLCRQDDLVIGSPFAGRRLAEIEPLIGFFVSTLPLRIDLSGDPTFLELLARVRSQVLGAHEHQDVPFEKLVEELHPDRALGVSPIFQVMFALQQQHEGAIALPGLEIEAISATSGTSKFDLTLSLGESGDRISGGFEYDRDLFEPARIEGMIRQFLCVVEQVAAEPHGRLSDVELSSPDELERLLPVAPAVEVDLLPVHRVIEAQAKRTPEAIAVESAEGAISYRTLVERAKSVAAALVARGVQEEGLVAVAVERSIDMVVAVLGVLEAGAAYVPFDPAYPKERLAFMQRDSGAKVVLTTQRHAGLFPASEVLDLASVEPTQHLAARGGGLAYCLYTSGSTGQPKGVLIEHNALAHHMRWMAEALPIDALDRVLMRTSLSFDASVWELFLPLMVGARLVLAPPDLSGDTERLVKVMKEKRVTVLQVVPSLLGPLVEEPGLGQVTTLRRICAGGEPLPSATVAKCFEVLGDALEVFNLYGPTECTIDATAHRSNKAEVGRYGANEPIGKAIRGMQALVLDERLRPVPLGVPGELYLAGPCVARGYHNRPELTASRFVEHTFANQVMLRMYKTGDVVQSLVGGTLLFKGRADRQVKLRGFRIELGEVEAALLRHPGVKEAAVLVKGQGGEARLVAFVSPRAENVPAAEVKRFLEHELAPHMVPGQLIWLPELPHAPNGKLDHRALLEVANPAVERPKVEAAPRDPIELELVRIFEEILGLPDVGIRDSFFDLGGHSLLALKLKLAIEQRLGQAVPLVSLFQSPTPEQLGSLVRSGAEHGEPSPLVPLSPEARARLSGVVGARPPVFLIPGGGSTPFYLMALARRLEGWAVFGLQPRGLDGEAPPHRTVEETAAYYLGAIKQVQPEGPYLLGGHSIGGHVAYEIAQQLKGRGDAVGMVALLDTVAPFPEATRPMGQGWDTAQWLVQICGVMEGFFQVKVGLDAQELRALGESERFELVVARLVAAGILPQGAGARHVRGILEVAQAQDGMAYQPRPGAPLPLFVFRAEEKNDPDHPSVGALIADEALGWGRFTGGAVEACAVPGTHLTLVREPHVAALATELLGRL